MAASHVLLDHVLLVLVTIVWPVTEWLYYYPRSVRAIAAGVPGARLRVYRNLMLPSWGFTACVAALWVVRGRPWSALLVRAGTPLQLGIGGVLVALTLGLLWAQRRVISTRPEAVEALRRQLAKADALIPRTTRERRWFAAVSITAGICEEFLFRGFVMWYFVSFFPSSWIGTTVAVVMSSALFGFGHIYLGLRHVNLSGAAGVVWALNALWAGSLWPVVVMHAVLDLNSGDLGWRTLAGTPAAADAAS